MFRYAASFKTIFKAPDPLTVRETAWGYLIRSTKPSGDLAARLSRFAIATGWISVVGIWMLPAGMGAAPGFVWKAFTSVAVLGVMYLVIALLRRPTRYEVQVDLRRREFRMGTLTRKGKSWLRSSARFDEIGDSLLRRVSAGAEAWVLCIRVKDAAEAVPIAVGDEATLLAVHDRLMRDLSPLTERVSSSHLSHRPAHRVFPQLGPQQVAA